MSKAMVGYLVSLVKFLSYSLKFSLHPNMDLVNGPKTASQSPIHAHIHTPMAESTTQCDSQLVRSRQGVCMCVYTFHTPPSV